MSKQQRQSAPLKFVDDAGEDYKDDFDEDNSMDMLGVLHQFHKQQAAKLSTRSAAVQQKKNVLVAKAHEDAQNMIRAGDAYIVKCKAKIEDLRQQESHSDGVTHDVMRLWTIHDESIRSLMCLYPLVIEDLGSRRSKDINAASITLETHPLAREASRRRLMKNAKRNLETGIENQKIAMDASALVKHYEALLLC